MGMEQVTVSMRKKAAESEAENNKADLLARIDGAIKCGTDNLLSSIDRLASNKKHICDLKQLRSEVESGRIGEGAKAVVEQALRYMW
jgi:hypothetical protein